MNAERLRPGEIESRRRRALARYVRREVHPYSELNRRRLDEAGLGARVTTVDALARLRPMALTDVADPRSLVLRPTLDSILAGGEPLLRWRATWARVVDRRVWLNDHVIGPVFKPVHWTEADGTLLGWSSDDLDRLADLGRRWLSLAGLRRDDTLLTVLATGPSLEFWQTALGARAAGISTVHLGRPADAEELSRLAPTVVAGRVDDLMALDLAATTRVRTVLVLGDLPDDTTRTELATRAGRQATVLAAWAPPGARALWSECRPGAGLHTWPETEAVQSEDDRLIWTPIGWRGSVLLRLATGVAGVVDPSPCPACGRTTPRVEILP